MTDLEYGKKTRPKRQGTHGRRVRPAVHRPAGAEHRATRNASSRPTPPRRDTSFSTTSPRTTGSRPTARISELNRELEDLKPRLEELEAAEGQTPDIDLICAQMLTAMKDFQKLSQEGTVDESRRLVRAFVHEIRLDPETGQGRAQVLILPDLSAEARLEPTTEKSSLTMVAGVRYGAEKKRLLAKVGLIFGTKSANVTAIRTPRFAAKRLCA